MEVAAERVPDGGRQPASARDEGVPRHGSVKDCYPANLCPLGCYVVNEVRRLADDSLSHDERPNARHSPEGRHCLLKHAVGMPGMTNFERKKE